MTNGRIVSLLTFFFVCCNIIVGKNIGVGASVQGRENSHRAIKVFLWWRILNASVRAACIACSYLLENMFPIL